MEAEGVTSIVNRLKPHIKKYLDQLIDDRSLDTREIHESYEYPAKVSNLKCWAHYGIFYDYLIRRELYVLCQMEAVDNRAEILKSAVKQYYIELENGNRKGFKQVVYGKRISINRWNIGRLKKLVASYEIFKNIKFDTIDVLEHIFNTSMLHMMSYGRKIVRYCPKFVNWDNINDVLKYVKTWSRQGIQINPTVSGRCFIGDADLIFPYCVMDMKVSKFKPSQNRSKFNRGIYQMIFYALGNFIKTNRATRRFKVYNPLRGEVYILDLPNIDFHKLRQKMDNKFCWTPKN